MYPELKLLNKRRRGRRKNGKGEREFSVANRLPRDPLLRYSEHVAEFGKREFAKARQAHEEGLIAKHAAGLYYSGMRCRSPKLASRRQSFAISANEWHFAAVSER
jgi:hypothetical protein